MVKLSKQLRFRRGIKRTRKNVENAQDQASAHLDKHVVRRWQKFIDVRRFVLGWLVLIVLLGVGIYIQTNSLKKYYIETIPDEGGIYSEGVVGEVTNFNPIFANTETDKTVAALLFEPLIRYNQEGELVPALADSWQVNQKLNEYTLKLNSQAKWHDGWPISSRDVLFTFETIQHPDAASSLNRSWRDVKISTPDDKTVVFSLPNPFTPFLYSLTGVGILPSHLLGDTQPKELRAHAFNLSPTVGSGPFKFASSNNSDNRSRIRLVNFDQYYKGKPKISEVIIEAFNDQEELTNAFNDGEVSGAAGLRINDLQNLDDTHKDLIRTPLLYSNVLLFFKTTDGLLKDKSLRQVLIEATEVKKISDALKTKYPTSISPLLKDQIGYSSKFTQLKFNLEKAQKGLDKLGWIKADDGFRYRKGQKLELNLVTQNTDEYPIIAEEIQRQWREIGIVLKLEVLNPAKLQQDKILPHSYQLILLGIEQGVDPDVFAFWHSSQAKIGSFNLSEYKNSVVDVALEAGRTRSDAKLRAAKYEAFLKEWQSDAPAMALYRPVYFYGQLKSVKGCFCVKLANPTDRFFDIQQWTIRTDKAKVQI